MQIITQELSTLIASMSVVNPEERAFGPVIDLALFALRFHNVEYDCDTIFIVVPDDALVGVSAVRSDYAVAFAAVLGGLVVREQERILFNARQFLPQTLEQTATS